jgi:hypothetical protein
MTWEDPPQPFDESSDAAAFALGVFDGFRRLSPKPKQSESTKRDPYYYKFGFVLGYILSVAVLIAAAKYGLGL